MRKALVGLTALAALTGAALATAPNAQASTTTLESRALSIAISKRGDAYQYGAEGPYRFDCSGLTWYAFRHAGKAIPRTTQEQWESSSIHHVYARDRRPGDIVFFHSGGNVYHVGIYAGNGEVWHAPHSGAYVREERIWTSSVWYGRP